LSSRKIPEKSHLNLKLFKVIIHPSRGEREGAEWVVREGVGAGGRNDPSLVCTYE
jgi:hypothetical protein